jgi:hypothetical protein
MPDQAFQPGTTDATQDATIPSQGGVFGGFVGAEDAAVSPQLPDSSVLFGDTPAVTEPVVEEAVVEETVVEETPATTEPTSFADLNLSQIEETPTIEEAVTEPVIEEAVVEPEMVVEPVIEETPIVEQVMAEPRITESPTTEYIEPVVETPAVEEAPVVEETPVTQEPVVETPELEISDIRAKYNELANNIAALTANNPEGTVEIVGSNTDSAHIDYTFKKEEEILDVTRTETDKGTEETSENTISFVLDPEENEVNVFLDDVLLFEEHELIEDAKKKMQVMEKFNKFIFLTGEKLKDLEKARKAQEAELQEKRRLQDIFRNF